MGSRAVNAGAQNDKKVVAEMPSFVPAIPTSNPIGTETGTIHSSRISDFGTLEQSIGFCIEDVVDLSRNPVFNQLKSTSQAIASDIQFGTLNKPLAPAEINLSTTGVGPQTLLLQREPQPTPLSIPGGHRENWGEGETSMAEGSPRTDTSTEDSGGKNVLGYT